MVFLPKVHDDVPLLSFATGEWKDRVPEAVLDIPSILAAVAVAIAIAG